MAHKIKHYAPGEEIPHGIIHKRQFFTYADKRPSNKIEDGFAVRFERILQNGR